MAKYKIGDRFNFLGGIREIIGVYESGDDIRYWIAYPEECRDLDTVSEWYVDEKYTKIEPFFEEGKRYGWRHGGSAIYTVDTVRGTGDNRVALVQTSFGSWDILKPCDFGQAVEIN